METTVDRKESYFERIPQAGLIFLGAFLILCGIFAVAYPVVASIGLSLALGAILFVSGLAQTFHAFQNRKKSGVGMLFLMAALAVVAGLLMILRPMEGLVGLTVVLAFFFLMSGIAKILYSLDLRPHQGWGWMMTSAVLSLIMGAFLVITLPYGALFAPGLLYGIDLIVFGGGLVGMSWASKPSARVSGPALRPS